MERSIFTRNKKNAENKSMMAEVLQYLDEKQSLIYNIYVFLLSMNV